ncbi:2,3-diketo-5-methylthio-1-phosphopentane phosphatase [Alsobacter metallidurans]|uniref:2,3-diketo-5-methylthio-1-phosphopentane phosphatase n=1 Tax=Alsobacter metallidurans TaxID=340221 RepID=A0A917I6B8_9HYPH|nr:2,3-diketo-5-methylthio-1-phosphopentane phosphatase [Alsobacter metallidurans]
MVINQPSGSPCPGVRVLCDFDGTITAQDVTDLVLSKLAAPEWLHVEELWRSGAIGSGECMRRQVALMRCGWSELDDLLDRIDVEPGFVAFARGCARMGLRLEIVSDGLDYAIRRILGKRRLDLPIRANRLLRGEDGRWSLATPFADARCLNGAAHCKCWSGGSAPVRYTVVIGDGRSDMCVAERADLVFAKQGAEAPSPLLRHCGNLGLPHVAFTSFDDLGRALEAHFAQWRMRAAS